MDFLYELDEICCKYVDGIIVCVVNGHWTVWCESWRSMSWQHSAILGNVINSGRRFIDEVLVLSGVA